MTSFADQVARSSALARASMERGLRHVEAERHNDPAMIMATIDPAPYFPLIDHDGEGGLTVRLLTDTASVEAYYRERHGSYEIVESRQIAAVTTDWYTFRESVATLRGVGEVGGIESAGRLFDVNSAVLFPTTPAGIGGELVFTRYPFGDVVAGRVERPGAAAGPAHLPNTRLAVADVHDAWLSGWRNQDPTAMADQVAVDARWERRERRADDASAATYLSAADGTEAAELFADVCDRLPTTEITVLNRLITDWYVFADLQIELADGSSARHIALHPNGPDGRLRAEIGDFVLTGKGS